MADIIYFQSGHREKEKTSPLNEWEIRHPLENNRSLLSRLFHGLNLQRTWAGPILIGWKTISQLLTGGFVLHNPWIESRCARLGLARIWPDTQTPLFPREILNKETMNTKARRARVFWGRMRWKGELREVLAERRKTTYENATLVPETVSQIFVYILRPC